MSSKKQDEKKNNYDDVKVDEHGWPEEAYDTQKRNMVFQGRNDSDNTRQIVIFVTASVIASLLATFIATTIYHQFFSE